MKKKILAVIVIFAIAFIGGYIFKEPKAEAATGSFKTQNGYTIQYTTITIGGDSFAVFYNKDATSISAVQIK